MCLHGKPSHISPRAHIFQNWGSLHAPAGGTRGRLLPSRAGSNNGYGIGYGGSPLIGCP